MNWNNTRNFVPSESLYPIKSRFTAESNIERKPKISAKKNKFFCNAVSDPPVKGRTMPTTAINIVRVDREA